MASDDSDWAIKMVFKTLAFSAVDHASGGIADTGSIAADVSGMIIMPDRTSECADAPLKA